MFNIMNMHDNYVPLKIKRKILSDPSKEYSVRELARALHVSPASVSKALKELEAKGIVLLKSVGRSKIYNANLESALCRQWKVLFNLELIRESSFLPECKKTLKNILAITLYGSRAMGTNNTRSDYDFVIITATTTKKKPDPSNFALDSEVNCFVFSFAEWKKHAQKNTAFYNDVLFYGIELEGQKMVVL